MPRNPPCLPSSASHDTYPIEYKQRSASQEGNAYEHHTRHQPARYGPRHRARESIRWSIALSIVLIVAGLFAIFAPLLAGVALTGILGWLLILVGAGHLWLAWHVRGAGAHLWEALIGLAYVLAGVFLLIHPVAGLVGITAILGAYLLLRGIFELIAGLSMNGVRGRGWLLFNGAISLILAFMIWRHLPYSAEWFIGTLIGFAILFTGISRLALALTARRLLAVPA